MATLQGLASATEPSPEETVALVRASYDAYVTKSREWMERLLAADFHFTSPLDNRIDRSSYFARCWPNSENIESFTFVNLVAARDRVFVTYEGRTRSGHSFRNTEIVTTRGHEIVDVEVYFGWSLPHEAAPGKFVDKPR